MDKSENPTVLAITLAFGPVILILAGAGVLAYWMIGQDRAQARAQAFLAKVAHLHLEDRVLAWEEFQRKDPEAAKFIVRSGTGKGVRLSI